MSRIWDDVIPEEDREIYAKAGYGKRGRGLGKRVALLVVDFLYAFIGDRPEPVLESIKRFPNSCGIHGWRAIRPTQELIQAVRKANGPIIYAQSQPKLDQPPQIDPWTTQGRYLEKTRIGRKNDVVDEIAPEPGDIVIDKHFRPSMFNGTPLVGILNSLGVDTCIVCGCTTSGCVRATVVDAFSYNYKVIVAEECVFDRSQLSHKVNLFEMNQKYADVLPLSEVIAELSILWPNAAAD